MGPLDTSLNTTLVGEMEAAVATVMQSNPLSDPCPAWAAS